MPSNPPQLLTAAQYLQHSVISVVPASLTDPCGICQDPYDAPVVLTCGHIFCRRCVTPWLDGGASTCPACRATLFVPLATSSGSVANVADVFGGARITRAHPLLAPYPFQRATRTTAGGETYLGDRLVASNGALGHFGCCLLIYDLWHHTARLLHSIEEFCGRELGPTEAQEMDVELLRSCIRRAIPDGVRIKELEEGALYLVASQMLKWHSVGCDRADWTVLGEFDASIEALLEACLEERGSGQN